MKVWLPTRQHTGAALRPRFALVCLLHMCHHRLLQEERAGERLIFCSQLTSRAPLSCGLQRLCARVMGVIAVVRAWAGPILPSMQQSATCAGLLEKARRMGPTGQMESKHGPIELQLRGAYLWRGKIDLFLCYFFRGRCSLRHR